MKLTNTMERAVRSRLALLHEERGRTGDDCWCPLCRADMMALALSSLPPRYGTKHVDRNAHAAHVALADAPALAEAITKAVRHVGRFPKHLRGSAVPAAETVWVVNFPLEESFHVVDVLLKRLRSCDCWQCRCDIVAFALNRYPARYGVEHRGRTLLVESDRARMRRDLGAYLSLGTRVVGQLPRH